MLEITSTKFLQVISHTTVPLSLVACYYIGLGHFWSGSTSWFPIFFPFPSTSFLGILAIQSYWLIFSDSLGWERSYIPSVCRMTAVSCQQALKRDEGEQVVNKAKLQREDPRLTIGVILRKRTCTPSPLRHLVILTKQIVTAAAEPGVHLPLLGLGYLFWLWA